MKTQLGARPWRNIAAGSNLTSRSRSAQAIGSDPSRSKVQGRHVETTLSEGQKKKAESFLGDATCVTCRHIYKNLISRHISDDKTSTSAVPIGAVVSP